MPARECLPILDDRVVEGEELVPDDWHPAEDRKRPEEQDVELTHVPDEHDVRLRRLQEADDESRVGQQGLRQLPDLVPSGQHALVARVLPDGRVALVEANAALPQSVAENAVSWLAEVVGPPEQHPEARIGVSLPHLARCPLR